MPGRGCYKDLTLEAYSITQGEKHLVDGYFRDLDTAVYRALKI